MKAKRSGKKKMYGIALLYPLVILSGGGVANLATPVLQNRKLEPNRYGWFSDYAAALQEARRSGKPIFLVFRCEP